MTITPGDTLIILDEIQNALKAFESLKYLCEDAPEYHVMAAGSLSGVALHKGVSYPVGAIITQYRGDFGKHASAKELPKINMVWDSIPMQLAKENRKFFWGNEKGCP